MMDHQICIAVFAEEIEADMAQGFLDANGIKSHIETDDCGGARSFLQPTNGVKLLVEEAVAEEARALLEQPMNTLPVEE